MRMPLHGRTVALLVGSLLVVQWSLDAQSKPTASKRPLTYDVVDYWKSIGGTRISDDGQWLSYSVTSQAADGELIVRNLKTSQEFKHPRGTGAQFTGDGKFVIFTIAQSKADEERERLANRGRGAAGGEGGETPAGGTTPPATAGATRDASRDNRGGARRTPGWRTTGRRQCRARHASAHGPRHHVAGRRQSGDRRSRRQLQARRRESHLAGLLQGHWRWWRRRRRRPWRRRGAGAPPAAPAGGAGRGAAATPNARERKQPGSDLILRNMATGEETTIAEVTEYFWNKKGTLLAYAVSSNDATKDGAFVRTMSNGSRHGAPFGQRTLPQPRVRRSRHADHLPQRPGRLRQARRAVSRLLLEDRRRQGRRARGRVDGRDAQRHGGCG